MKQLKITSPAFQHNGLMPSKYACDGENINPPLSIEDIPEGTQSLALIMDDPDALLGTWNHWIVWNIPPTKNNIDENSVPGTQGTNSARKQSYGGPCPPFGTHRYFFKICALDTKLTLSPNSKKKDLEKAMLGHVLAQGELVGLYKRR